MTDLFTPPEIIELSEFSSLHYFPCFYPDQIFQQLLSNVDWQQRKIRMFGKWHDEPRLTAWFGPAYQYANVQWPKTEMPDLLDPLLQAVKERASFPFNAVLLNYYRNGNDSMGWHRDNEPEIDDRCIASVSFGAERIFSVRNKMSKATHRLLLQNGSLLLMINAQKEWEHALPKRKKLTEARLNLTFRRVIL
jgi:alkylated DNA repair dioxygenase AlkB